MRDFAHADSMSDEQLKHLALIFDNAINRSDLALRCVMLLEQRQATERWKPSRSIWTLSTE